MDNWVYFTKYVIKRSNSREMLLEKYKGNLIIGRRLNSDPIRYCTECQNSTCTNHFIIDNQHYRYEEEF